MVLNARVQAGVPAGGQFAATVHDETTTPLAVPGSAGAYLAENPGVVDAGETVTVEGSVYSPKHTIIVGVRDRAAVDAFTGGQCHALALALHERTGWPLVSVGPEGCSFDEDCPDDDDSDGVCACQIEHLAVERPDGFIVDIRGPQHRDEFVLASSDPDCNTVKPVPGDRVSEIFYWDEAWRRADMPVARGFVDVALTEWPTDDGGG